MLQTIKKYILKPILKIFVSMIILSIAALLLLWIQASSLYGVNKKVVQFEEQLNARLKKNGYKAQYLIISGKRSQLQNDFLVWIGSGAAKRSQHLQGNAIDILVLDINGDASCNHQDIDIVYQLLDQQIVKSKGGLGTYKKSGIFFNQQMVHFDCRGRYARWHK